MSIRSELMMAREALSESAAKLHGLHQRVTAPAPRRLGYAWLNVTLAIEEIDHALDLLDEPAARPAPHAIECHP